VKSRNVQGIGQSWKGVEVMISGHSHDVNACIGEPLDATLESPEGLVHFVLAVDEVARQHDGVHVAADGRVKDPPPYVVHRECVVLDRDSRRMATEMHVADAENSVGFIHSVQTVELRSSLSLVVRRCQNSKRVVLSQPLSGEEPP